MGLTGEDKEIGDGGGFQAGVDDAPPPPPENQENSAGGPRVIRYRECLRNHAVSIGGSVTDGCGEFMPAGEEGTVASLKCAACNCHRNFHRQETPHGDGGAPPPPNPPALPSFASMTHRHNAWASLAALSPKTFGGAKPPTTAVAVSTAATSTATVASSFQEPNFNPHKCFTSAPFPSAATATAAPAPATVASSFQEPNFNPHKCFSSAPFPTPATAAPVTVASSFQEPTFNPHKCFNSAPFPSPATAAAPAPAPPSETRGKKRFRTKFTADQKEKMTEFADKIGWRIPREEENINGVERFCGEIGVKRQVFKVWMHNNKSSAKPNATSPSQSSSSSINN